MPDSTRIVFWLRLWHTCLFCCLVFSKQKNRKTKRRKEGAKMKPRRGQAETKMKPSCNQDEAKMEPRWNRDEIKVRPSWTQDEARLKPRWGQAECKMRARWKNNYIDFGPILAPFWLHFGFILGRFSVSWARLLQERWKCENKRFAFTVCTLL